MDLLHSFQQSTSNSAALSISWLKGEKAAKEILDTIHPTVVSEQRRITVTDYIQTRFKRHLRIEVYPVGSVPLRTYLPDDDINLTAFCSQNEEHDVVQSVYTFLKVEEESSLTEFDVRNVQYIDAEIKLITCSVQNLSLTISFNQLGRLKQVWFLEQVDRKIGKNHIFKRSIIFIKSWCYYESRILGARHSLLSSYALETLVLYIFQVFHSSIDGPLSALYKFLDYYGKFDWDKYCISLSGLVCRSSLPEILVEKPEKEEDDLLLSKEYIKHCADIFSVPQNMHETKPFLPIHMNIINPLQENDNLGRNITEGNFYRIRSCFSYGAKDFRKILAVPEEHIAVEIRKRFSKIIRTYGSGYRLNVNDYVSSESMVECAFHAKDSIQEGINRIRISSEPCPAIVDKLQKHAGDARDLATSINTERGTSIRCHVSDGSLADLSGNSKNYSTNLMSTRSCIMVFSGRNPDKRDEEWEPDEFQTPVEDMLVYSLPYENRPALVLSTPEGSMSSQAAGIQEVHLEEERVALQTYTLEDDDDFPPLSVLRRK